MLIQTRFSREKSTEKVIDPFLSNTGAGLLDGLGTGNSTFVSEALFTSVWYFNNIGDFVGQNGCRTHLAWYSILSKTK